MDIATIGQDMDARAKSISMMLHDGTLGGVVSIESSSWNSGELYSAPRDSVQDLLETGACNKYGVYLLLSRDQVYIGQSSDLARRLGQHLSGKDWWTSAVILTTKDDNLNHTDIDYLETKLIERASEVGQLDSDNRRRGNDPKVDRFREVFLDQYLEEALFLMELIGIKVFAKMGSAQDSSGQAVHIGTMDAYMLLAYGTGAKGTAIDYLEEQGLRLGKSNDITYAALNKARTGYWANPNIRLLKTPWYIILNDTDRHELVVLHVSADALSLAQYEGDQGLRVRKDKPEQLDLVIERSGLVDVNSSTNFLPYVVKHVAY